MIMVIGWMIYLWKKKIVNWKFTHVKLSCGYPQLGLAAGTLSWNLKRSMYD
jgi:hypothetical protein